MKTKQNPQCEGHNRDCIWFTRKIGGRQDCIHVVRRVKQEYIMEAGTAHGITDGAIFALYTDRSLVQAPVATLKASNPKGATTILVPLPESAQPDIDKQAFALLIKAGEESFRIHVEPNEKLKTILEKIAEEREKYDSKRPKVILVEKEKAELDITIDREKLVFNITDQHVRVHGLHRLYDTTPLTFEAVRPVIRKAAHYFWHLRRTGNTKRLLDLVDIEFTRLKEVDEEYDDVFNPVRRPCGPNLIKDGVIDIVIEEEEEEAIYGIKIVNKSETPLYPSFFYFDNSDLSISM
jgi:hypothetical protein